MAQTPKKIKAYTAMGGVITIDTNRLESVSGGASNLNQEEFNAYQKARLQANPLNGGDLNKVKETLEAAGFEVYFE